MGWTRSTLGVTVALVMEEHRRAAGQRLAKIRDAAGLSQEELAGKAGLAVKTISRLETGRHDGRRSTIKRVAAALGVDVDDIIGPPPAPLGLGAGESQLDRIEAKLDRALSLLERLDLDRFQELLADAGARDNDPPASGQGVAAARAKRSRRAS